MWTMSERFIVWSINFESDVRKATRFRVRSFHLRILLTMHVALHVMRAFLLFKLSVTATTENFQHQKGNQLEFVDEASATSAECRQANLYFLTVVWLSGASAATVVCHVAIHRLETGSGGCPSGAGQG